MTMTRLEKGVLQILQSVWIKASLPVRFDSTLAHMAAIISALGTCLPTEKMVSFCLECLL